MALVGVYMANQIARFVAFVGLIKHLEAETCYFLATSDILTILATHGDA